MDMKKETRRVMRLARRGLPRERYARLKEIENRAELHDAAKRSMFVFLESEYLKLREKTEALEQQGSDVFFVHNALDLIPGKLAHLKVDFSDEAFKKIDTLFKTVKRELSYV